MLCLCGFELYSRWVPQFPFLFLTHSLFFSDIPGSQPHFHSDSLFNMLEKAPYKDLSDFSVILSYYAYAK